MSKLWGGRFEGGLDPFFEGFNRSLGFDARMVQQDIEGSVAWAEALRGAGVLKQREAQQIQKALRELGAELATDPRPLQRSKAEDVHSFVETALGKKVGALAKKLHTGRSRNDQVATDLKLYLREAIAGFSEALAGLMLALVHLAEKHAADPIPGFTHLQRAQPVTIGHHALAYVEMLQRDLDRLGDAEARMDTCPLGCGALAGTAFPIDRRALAEALDFGGPTRNSLDTVSDRDHACELMFCCSLTMLHLSRLSEDWIFFASQDAGFMTFGDAVATGSSLMPQKKNPDAMELLRGKCGRVIGDLNALLITLKGLPLAYNKDMQEDKEALFDALDTTISCVRVATTAVQNARYDTARCAQEAARGYLNATDLADLLVQTGTPFRDAHEVAGQAVNLAVAAGCEIEELPEEQLRELAPKVGGDLRKLLSVQAVLGRRKAIGGTAPSRVKAEVKSWKRRLGA